MKRARKYIILFTLLIVSSTSAHGQKWCLSTNIIDYANFAALNAEAGYSLSQHWSLFLNGKWNPFVFNAKEGPGKQFQNKSLNLAFGAKFWPFFVYSGFFYGFKFQWQQYNRGGIISPDTYQGDAIGGGISFGYALLLTKNINIEFGVGLWSGWTEYTHHAYPKCGKTIGKGEKWFVYPNDILINICYTF